MLEIPKSVELLIAVTDELQCKVFDLQKRLSPVSKKSLVDSTKEFANYEIECDLAKIIKDQRDKILSVIELLEDINNSLQI